MEIAFGELVCVDFVVLELFLEKFVLTFRFLEENFQILDIVLVLVFDVFG